ncbi:odorant-binding protein-like isoform X2 [Mesocricetus auratus]|uniref:Odorant-binding protein-like isoform X2 n=1 Tax=Mesocricetus auratus TaxID=10036 RepID=A0ABM2X1L9_MESAU|nr:odorant-binding protein-like isoform X2 [Mesocricetus auratus]
MSLTAIGNFSGNFNTIYLAAKDMILTEENSQVRILMREVNFFKNYTLISMTFYVRKNGKCQLHTVWADRLPYNFYPLTCNNAYAECKKKVGSEKIIGIWTVRGAFHHFPKIYYEPQVYGGLTRYPSVFYIQIHFASNTTIIFELIYVNDLGYRQRLTGALATGKNITEEMWKEYLKRTQDCEIPIENIKNIYEADACPKWNN